MLSSDYVAMKKAYLIIYLFILLIIIKYAMHHNPCILHSLMQNDFMTNQSTRCMIVTLFLIKSTDCNVTMDGIKGIYNSNNSANEYYKMYEKKPECSQVSEHKFCSEEIHDFRFNSRSVEDNTNEGEHRSSLLERILLDEETQGFTSPTIYIPSGKQEDVDLIQSLQIREARIRDLARKRDRLLNLAGLKLK